MELTDKVKLEVLDRTITQERTHDLCVEFWNDIAENGYLNKSQSSWAKLTEGINDCFACEYYDSKGVYDCGGCPFMIFYDNDQCACINYGSPYEEWETACIREDKESAKKYAIEIADLFIDEL